MKMAERNPKSRLPLYAPDRAGSVWRVAETPEPLPPHCTCRIVMVRQRDGYGRSVTVHDRECPQHRKQARETP